MNVIREKIDNQDINFYIDFIVNSLFEANKYFNDSEPWALKKKDPDRMETILFTIVHQIKNISVQTVIIVFLIIDSPHFVD